MARLLVSSLLVLILLALTATPAGAAGPLRLGFLDDELSGPPATAAPWLQRATDVGADVVRVSSGWGSLAPMRPARPTDPDDPAYRWDDLDRAMRNAAGAGLTPLIALTGAPEWAQGPGRPASAQPGSWRPDAAAFGAFATALARRYDGSRPDPLRPGSTLPRARDFQPWNEPNLDVYLAPQWTRGRGGFANTGATLYRDLLNAFYLGIKAAQPQATVVSAGTAPFGDPQPGGRRTMPARFLRNVLCVSATGRRTCRHRVRFDAIAHHPYSVGAPTRSALNPDDVSIPDLARITGPVRDAVRLGRALPRGPKPLWITEVSYDSSPPDPGGVPAARHARWVQQAIALLARQGATVVTWYLIRDQAPEPSFGQTSQSGMFLRDGAAKPAATAFGFPLAVTRTRPATARVWIRAPAAGTIRIERRVAGRWILAETVRAERHAVVERVVRRDGATALRARQAEATSLAWRLG